ncbi:MAG: hypothetical protein ACUVXD_12660 [Thermodesulfobacteriota bacterium]
MRESVPPYYSIARHPNEYPNRVQFVLLTTRMGRVHPSEAAVASEGRAAKAMAGQIATVSKRRLFRRAGVICEVDKDEVDKVMEV